MVLALDDDVLKEFAEERFDRTLVTGLDLEVVGLDHLAVHDHLIARLHA